VLVAGCRTPLIPVVERGPSTPVWPPRPAAPRIAYVGSVRGAADLGVRVPWWTRTVNALTGRRKGREAFVKPFGLATGDDGSLCVADVGGAAVWSFDIEERGMKRRRRIGKQALVSPVAVARKGDFFYVADSGLGKVLAFDVRGKPVFEIGEPLRRPSGLAVIGDTLWVADSQAHRVLSFDLQGRYRSAIGERGISPGAFNFPTHLATDGKGQLYVTDSMNARVQVFDTDGVLQRVIGSLGDGSGHFSRPKGVAVDAAGRIYVVDALFDNVQVFDREGAFLMHWGAAGEGDGEFWLPAGIAVDARQRILVADSYNRRVQVFQYIGEP